MRSTRMVLAVAALALAAACGGGGAAPATGTPTGGEGALASLTLTHPEGAVTVGDTLMMQVQARDGSGQVMADVAATFTSSDEAVATVSAAGVVRGLTSGASTITASATAAGITKSATYGVAVLAAQTPPPPPAQTVASFVIDPASVTLAAGGTATLDAVARDGAGARITTLPQITWTTDNAGVATVANGAVTAGGAGTATIRAALTANGTAWSAAATVTVTAPAPPPPPPTNPSTAEVRGVDDAFSPSAVTIRAGGTVTWRMVDEEHDVAWQGAAPTGGNIGKMDRGTSVSRTFPATGVFSYTCSRHDGKHGGTVTVDAGAQQPQTFTSVRITPAGASVAVGGTAQLSATPLDQAGQPMGGLPAASWTSSNGSVATVSASGVVTGAAAGTASITARIAHDGVTREAAVNVTVTSGATPPPPPPPPPGAPLSATVLTPGTTFSPAAVTIRAGGTVTWQFTGSSRHNVTFSGTAPTGGNIPDTDVGGTAQRTFTAAGTYSYACTRHSGMNGQVVVQP